jgi:hypothetical protein
MPYLDPAAVLERFSGTLLGEVRPAIPDDEAVVRAQTGSMASTLRFLARELERDQASLAAQQEALLTALDDTERALAAIDDGETEPVTDAIESARGTVAGAADDDRETREAVILTAADDVLAAIDGALAGDDACRCRTPMYDFLDRRIQAHHAILGREGADDE